MPSALTELLFQWQGQVGEEEVDVWLPTKIELTPVEKIKKVVNAIWVENINQRWDYGKRVGCQK